MLINKGESTRILSDVIRHVNTYRWHPSLCLLSDTYTYLEGGAMSDKNSYPPMRVTATAVCAVSGIACRALQHPGVGTRVADSGRVRTPSLVADRQIVSIASPSVPICRMPVECPVAADS